jgi:hypothetical protein
VKSNLLDDEDTEDRTFKMIVVVIDCNNVNWI